MISPAPAVRQQIRGSTLLVSGRLLGAASNLVGQIVLARYLMKAEFGALAYALTIVTFCQSVAMLGMRTTLSRFVPQHHERGEKEQLVGVLFLAVVTTLSLGLAMVAALAWWPSALSRLFRADPVSLQLIAVMAYMIPLQALDILLINLFASFGKTRQIFLRKFVVTPLLKIAVVLVLVATNGPVLVMAYGYLASAVIALSVSLWGIRRVLRQEGLLGRRLPSFRGVAVGGVYAFSLSILAHELVQPFLHSANVFLLGYFHGPAAVAVYTVVLPVARMNRIVVDNVRVLFLPLASRMLARGDGRALNDLYWQTAMWMAIISFPIFCLSFIAARPLTELLYGAQYSSSSTILMLLAAAYYFHASIGCNSPALRALGRVRFLLGVDLLTTTLCLAGNLVLIRHYGALGAGICTAGTMVLRSLLLQLGLRRDGLAMFDARCMVFYPLIVACSLVILTVQRLAQPGLYGLVLVVAIVSLLLFAVTRKRLQIGEIFPELARMPVVRMLVT